MAARARSTSCRKSAPRLGCRASYQSPAEVYAAGAPFGALPLLAVGGLWLPDVSSARGKSGDEQVVNAWEGAGTVGFTIDFELMGA